MPKRDGLRSELKNGMRINKSVPGWEDRLEADIDAAPRRKRDWFVRPRFELGRTLNTRLNEAAYDRGMSRSAYLRRAVAAVIAYDLDMDIREILSDSPRVNGYDQPTPGPRDPYAGGDDVVGHGPWVIKEMRDCG